MNINERDHQVICFGESLWVTSPEGAEAGGSPVIMARHLRRLGMDPALITRVGIDEEGKRLISFIENSAISTDFFQVDYNVPTGLEHSGSFPFSQKPHAWDNIHWEASFESLISDARFFVHGSLPARSEISRKTLYTFMDMATQRVFDMNLHESFYTKKIIEDCLRGTYILKLNTDELELITGWFSRIDLVIERMQILQDKFDIPYIVVTSGSSGTWSLLYR